jgi:hypothetical protein
LILKSPTSRSKPMSFSATTGWRAPSALFAKSGEKVAGLFTSGMLYVLFFVRSFV